MKAPNTKLPIQSPWLSIMNRQAEIAREALDRIGALYDIVDVLEERGGEFGGPQLAPFRYSEDSHLGISGVAIAEVRDGAAEPITPTYVSDLGDAPIEELDTEQAAPPAGGIPEASE